MIALRRPAITRLQDNRMVAWTHSPWDSTASGASSGPGPSQVPYSMATPGLPDMPKIQIGQIYCLDCRQRESGEPHPLRFVFAQPQSA